MFFRFSLDVGPIQVQSTNFFILSILCKAWVHKDDVYMHGISSPILLIIYPYIYIIIKTLFEQLNLRDRDNFQTKDKNVPVPKVSFIWRFNCNCRIIPSYAIESQFNHVSLVL